MRLRWAVLVSVAGLVAAAVYGVYLAHEHQSAKNDQEMLSFFWVVACLVVGPVLLAPTWTALGFLLRSRVRRTRILLLIAASAPPAAAILAFSIGQWADWDEFIHVWIGLLPVLGAAIACYISPPLAAEPD